MGDMGGSVNSAGGWGGVAESSQVSRVGGGELQRDAQHKGKEGASLQEENL